MKTFADRLLDEIDRKQNPSVVGLDSDYSKLPDSLKQDSVEGPEAASSAMLKFNKVMIDSVRDIVPAVKIQSAFYEMYGHAGVKAFWETAGYAKSRGLIVVGDVKRNDIGNTSKAYSHAYLNRDSPFDCITVNPYLGTDGVKPFLEDVNANGKGIFVLVKTSNPSSVEIQDLVTDSGKVYERIAGLVAGWGSESGAASAYSSVGAVVGATYPKEAGSLRKLMPKSFFLVPGYGAQGGSASDVAPCFNSDGYGAVVVSARGIIFASRGDDFGEAARQAAMRMKSDLTRALRKRGICPW
jgi:orotidine-5'-phosphate decarboxylase